MAEEREDTRNGALAYRHDDGDEDARAEDVLDQILENYNFICHPEVRVKLKHELNNYALGLAVAKPWTHRPRVRFTVKPLEERSALARMVQKVLLVPTHAQVCVFSRKLQLGWLRLQFMAGYNWSRQRPTLDYRVTTKWSDGARFKRKERYSVGDSVLLRAKWNMDLHLPDMEGHLGADDLELDPIDVDFGRLDFEISQVDLVISPFQRRALQERRQRAQQSTLDGQTSEHEAGSSGVVSSSSGSKSAGSSKVGKAVAGAGGSSAKAADGASSSSSQHVIHHSSSNTAGWLKAGEPSSGSSSSGGAGASSSSSGKAAGATGVLASPAPAAASAKPGVAAGAAAAAAAGESSQAKQEGPRGLGAWISGLFGQNKAQ